MIDLPPGLILILGAFLLPLSGAQTRPFLSLIFPLLTLATIWFWTPEQDFVLSLANGWNLTLRTWHPLGTELLANGILPPAATRIFATIFALMAFAGSLFSLHKKANSSELPAAFVYAGSAIGVTFAGDILTLLIFWELMAIGSTVVLWSARTPGSGSAGMRYAIIHFVGGVIFMIGILGHLVVLSQDPNIANPLALKHFTFGAQGFDGLLQAEFSLHALAIWCILIGLLINAAAPPLGSWLADAYPEASETGTVFLSAFTTKTAVYVLLLLFAGTKLLIYVGLLMAIYGIIYAILENDMRRILAYSIVNQVGFMVCGIGIGTPMALNGTAAHAFAHIIYKALLLMSAGSVLYMTGKRKCTDLGGLYHSMPITMMCGIIGALAISAFPWTSGFVSKSMISQAAADEHLLIPWLVLTAASAGVFLHAGIKFPWFVFFQKDSGLRPKDPPWNMRLAMVLFASLCIGLGIYYKPLYQMLPYPMSQPGTPLHYEPYTLSHVISQLQLLMFSGLAFFVLLPLLKRTLTITLDADWVYRRFLPKLWQSILQPMVLAINRRYTRLLERAPQRSYEWLQSREPAPNRVPILFYEWSLGNAMALVTFILFIYLVIGFVQ